MSPIDGDIDEAAMAEADAALLALAEEYPAYAVVDVDQMEAALVALQAAGGRDPALIGEIYGTAHNVKGQGAAFGYELMTLLGEAICSLTRERDWLDGDAMARTGAMIAACRQVLDQRLLGLGGAPGARISADFALDLTAA